MEATARVVLLRHEPVGRLLRTRCHLGRRRQRLHRCDRHRRRVRVGLAVDRTAARRRCRRGGVVDEAEAARRALLRQQERARRPRHAGDRVRQRHDVQRLTEPVTEVAERRRVMEPTVDQPTRHELPPCPRLQVDATDGMHIAGCQHHCQQRLPGRPGVRAPGITEGFARDVVAHVRFEVRQGGCGVRTGAAAPGLQRQHRVEGEPPIRRRRIKRTRQPVAIGNQLLLDPRQRGLRDRGSRGIRHGRGHCSEREQRHRHKGKRRKATDRAHLHDSSHEHKVNEEQMNANDRRAPSPRTTTANWVSSSSGIPARPATWAYGCGSAPVSHRLPLRRRPIR